jgi:trk system potassium uptake protein TrkH
MNVRVVVFLLGRLLMALAAALLVPGILSLYYGERDYGIFFGPAAMAAVFGLLMQLLGPGPDPNQLSFGRREAFALVASAWFLASLVGALPFILQWRGAIADGIFESASGFTTTGASVLSNVEGEPRSILLWRALTQWLGGMGIIVLGIAILPKLAIGGMELLGAEAPGPMSEKLTPRIAATAKTLWVIYAILTSVQVLLLLALGVSPLDAVTHSFTTMATGGFSTRNASVGAFGSPAVEMVVALFMLLAGMNFALHFRWMRGQFQALPREPELRLYLSIVAVATALVAADLMMAGRAGSLAALRLSFFQVSSIMTTTGYGSADFDTWPHFSRAVLLLLMFVGGCSGSTGGSVKVVRALIVAKRVALDLRRLVQPHAVLPVRIGARTLPEEVVAAVVTFLILYLTLFALGGLALTAMGMDLVSAFSASASCLGNVGPGFGSVGPMQHYGHLPAAGKLLLAVLMIVGRLEVYTVLVVFFLRRR